MPDAGLQTKKLTLEPLSHKMKHSGGQMTFLLLNYRITQYRSESTVIHADVMSMNFEDLLQWIYMEVHHTLYFSTLALLKDQLACGKPAEVYL